MKERKVKNLEIVVPPGNAFRYETAPELPKLHQSTIFVGARGSGKGVSCYNFMKRLPFDRIFVISPTYASNKKILGALNIDDEDIYENPDDTSCVKNIVEKIEAEARDLDEYREKKKMYEKFIKVLNSSTVIDDEMLEAFYDGEGFKPPEHKWGGREPCMALVVDDCLGTNLFRSRAFANLVIKHRHVGPVKEGHGLGVSIFTMIQSYKSQLGGVPKCVRSNVTSMVVFKTKSEKEINEIAEECAGEVNLATFMSVYEEATKHDKHDFLFIDLHPKDGHSMFRRRFDTFLYPPSVEESTDVQKSSKKLFSFPNRKP